jgi:hypothetical protein
VPLTAQQICSLARQTARVPGYTAQSGQLLNAILQELGDSYDLDAAGKVFNSTFSGATAPIGNLNILLASGPFTLPADYLRADVDGVLYFPQGLANLPLRLAPIDIQEFDGLVQQAGFQNFPVFWATDMSNAEPVLSTTGNTHTTTTLDALPTTAGLVAGLGVAGRSIVPGTTLTAVGANSVTLSQAATASLTGISVYFAVPPIAYVWPPVTGAYPYMVRYRAHMPDIVTPETSTEIPWFPQQQYLITALTGRLMQIASDDRWEAFLSENETAHPAGAGVILRRYLISKDDNTNRAKRVTLDKRRFGAAWDRLPRSKVFGY